MNKKALTFVVLVVVIAVAISSCGTASSMRKSKIGCPSTRYSMGY
jgi:uncharacterized protein YceK